MDEETKNVVAGIPIDMEEWKPYKGSTIETCCLCGDLVYVGPEQKKKVEEGVEVWCLRCAYKEDPTCINRLIPLTNKQVGE